MEIVERSDQGINTRIGANVEMEIRWEAGVRAYKGFNKLDPNISDHKVNALKLKNKKSNLKR